MMAILAAWITAVISAGGYAGVALLMAMESACLPLPSEIIMPFAGFLVTGGRFDLWLVALAGAIGCNLGSAVAYWAGARGGRPAVARFGRYLLIDIDDLDLAQRFFHRFGPLAVFIGRLLPLVRTFIALPAGIARMKLLPFHLYTFIGSYIWCLVLAYIGQKLGQHWNSDPNLRAILHRLDGVAVIATIAAVTWFIWRRRARH